MSIPNHFEPTPSLYGNVVQHLNLRRIQMFNTNGLTEEQIAVVVGMKMDDGTATQDEIDWMAKYTEAKLKNTNLSAKTADAEAEGKLAKAWGWTWKQAKAVWKAIKAFFCYIGRACKKGWQKTFGKLFGKKPVTVDANNVVIDATAQAV
jgi:hypothetical protein